MKQSLAWAAAAAAALSSDPLWAQGAPPGESMIILSIDRPENRVVVRDPGTGQPRLVDLGSTTSIERPGAPSSGIDRLSIDDLRPGDRIRVHGSMQGDRLQARRIEIETAPPGQGGTMRDVGAPAPGSTEASPGVGHPPVQRGPGPGPDEQIERDVGRDLDPPPGEQIESDTKRARERAPGGGP
jgi:hypothetical protein